MLKDLLLHPFLAFDAADDAGSGDAPADATDAAADTDAGAADAAAGDEGAAPEPWTPPEGLADKFTEWGVEVNDLDSAVSIYQALQTEQGVIDMVVEGLRSLGFGVKDIEKFLREDGASPDEAAARAAAPAADATPDDEAIPTMADIKKLLQTEVIAPQREAQERAQVAAAQAAIGSFFDTQGVKDVETMEAVRGLAKRYLPDGDWDPAHIAVALEKGHADFEKIIETQGQAYLAKKAGDAAKVPTPVGGHVGGGDGDDRPDYTKLGSKALDTARQRVRDRLRASGELG